MEGYPAAAHGGPPLLTTLQQHMGPTQATAFGGYSTANGGYPSTAHAGYPTTAHGSWVWGPNPALNPKI